MRKSSSNIKSKPVHQKKVAKHALRQIKNGLNGISVAQVQYVSVPLNKTAPKRCARNKSPKMTKENLSEILGKFQFLVVTMNKKNKYFNFIKRLPKVQTSEVILIPVSPTSKGYFD